MMANITLGTLMMVLTTAVHTVFMVITFFVLERWSRHPRKETYHIRLGVVSGTILLLFAASLIEVSLWAHAYLFVGAVATVEDALYFSMVTFTTLGYGDIVLDERWRLLASFEAANGIIMFGWTTALVIAVVQRTFDSLLKRIRSTHDS